jgi:hypothetical protein
MRRFLSLALAAALLTPAFAVQRPGDLGGDLSLGRLLIDGEGWQLVAEGLGFADGPMTDAEGNFYFSDMKAPAIYRIALDGTKTTLLDELASGLKLGPDGRLYACQGAKKRLIAIDLKTKAIDVIAEDVQPNDLVISRAGQIYFTGHAHRHQNEGAERGGHGHHGAEWDHALAGPGHARGERLPRWQRVDFPRGAGRDAQRESAHDDAAAADRSEG